METTLLSDETESAWEQISPHLNDALDKLSERDREAVLIRFFQYKSHREVAGALGISEDAAKMRVSRAIEKLRSIFARQGFAVPSVVLLAALTAHSAQAAPAGLNAVVAAAAAKGTAGAVSTLTLANGILKFMAWSKTKTALVAGVALLLAGTTTVVVLQLAKAKPPPNGRVAADRGTPKDSLLAISRAIDMYSSRSRMYQVRRTRSRGRAPPASRSATILLNACRVCPTKSAAWNWPLMGFQPICPASTTKRPEATAPFEYPFGRGQPSGCTTSGPLSRSANVRSTMISAASGSITGSILMSSPSSDTVEACPWMCAVVHQ